MKALLMLALIGLAACTNPILSTEMTFGNNGVSVNPTLSGKLGGATVSVQP